MKLDKFKVFEISVVPDPPSDIDFTKNKIVYKFTALQLIGTLLWMFAIGFETGAVVFK